MKETPGAGVSDSNLFSFHKLLAVCYPPGGRSDLSLALRCRGPEFTTEPGWIEPRSSICMAFQGLQDSGKDCICVCDRHWLWSLSCWPFGKRGTLYKE